MLDSSEGERVRTVVVTGASSGIGAAVNIRLASHRCQRGTTEKDRRVVYSGCRESFRTLYFRLSRFQDDLQIASGAGRYGKIIVALSNAPTPDIFDDYKLDSMQIFR